MTSGFGFSRNFSIDFYGQFYATTTIYGYIKNENIKESYKTLLAVIKLEKQIDILVYEIYSLNSEEVDFLELTI